MRFGYDQAEQMIDDMEADIQQDGRAGDPVCDPLARDGRYRMVFCQSARSWTSKLVWNDAAGHGLYHAKKYVHCRCDDTGVSEAARSSRMAPAERRSPDRRNSEITGEQARPPA